MRILRPGQEIYKNLEHLTVPNRKEVLKEKKKKKKKKERKKTRNDGSMSKEIRAN